MLAAVMCLPVVTVCLYLALYLPFTDMRRKRHRSAFTTWPELARAGQGGLDVEKSYTAAPLRTSEGKAPQDHAGVVRVRGTERVRRGSGGEHTSSV